jgi:GDP-mannose 4,6-dehydratase
LEWWIAAWCEAPRAHVHRTHCHTSQCHCVYHRHHRAGRLLPRRAAARQGLSRRRHRARSSTTPYERIAHLVDRLELVSADLLDQTSLTDVVHDCQPDEIYNLAAQSFVKASWTQPVLTGEFTALGVTRMLEAMKKAAPKARFYQASSSEQFGKVIETPQTESTPFYPRSPTASRRSTGTGSR